MVASLSLHLPPVKEGVREAEWCAVCGVVLESKVRRPSERVEENLVCEMGAASWTSVAVFVEEEKSSI